MFPQGSLYSLAQNGFVWSADTSLSTGLALNTYLRFKIANPQNSGRNLVIYAFGAFINSNATMTVYKNATTTISANTITAQNLNAGSSNTSVATLAWDTSASDFAGGSMIRHYGFSASSPYEYAREIYILTPGTSLGLSTLLTLSLGNTAMAHLTWIEQP